MKKRDIAMLVGLTVLFVVAGVLVVVGVTTHTEAGLMAHRWDHMPLTVSCARYSEHTTGGCGDVSRTTTRINQRLGFPVLMMLDRSAVEADVMIVVGAPAEIASGWDEAGGDADIVAEDGLASLCFVQTRNTGTTELLHMVLEHELGHCLGLAHDDFDSSIMRPTQRPTPDGVFPPRITDHDRALLRETYDSQ